MAPYVKSRSQKAGLPPGALVHVGERFREKTSITALDYDEDHVDVQEIENVTECLPFRDTPSVTWITIAGLHDIGLLEELGIAFGLHPLIVEDILNTDQRPKVEDGGTYLYIVLRMIDGTNGLDAGKTDQISIILGRNYVLSFLERDTDVLKPIRNRITEGKGKIRKMGPDYLTHAIIDTVVDNYFLVLEKIGERIEEVEEELMEKPTADTLHAIQQLKKEMLLLRKAVWPLREAVGYLERSESDLIEKPTAMYFKDIYDHTIQVMDTIETFRDMLSGMLDIYLSSVSNKMNQIMKVLTIMATLFMPLSFVAGIYGMNFEYMPELKWQYGYLMFWAIILFIVTVMIVTFRRRGWV